MDATNPLDGLRIASPCPASWDAMRGDDRVRFCDSCRKHVYNLSAMSRVDAEELLRKTEGKLCAQIHRRRDGTVLTADCPVGMREALTRRLRRLARLAAAVTGLWALNSYLQATERWPYSTPTYTARTSGPAHRFLGLLRSFRPWSNGAGETLGLVRCAPTSAPRGGGAVGGGAIRGEVSSGATLGKPMPPSAPVQGP